jgi:mono/diheme cytochrome c family protein
VALATGGCSVKAEDNANLIRGKQQFVAKCGSCHTLARANTKGIVGPNLDESFRQSIAEGLRRSTVRGVVEGQVLNPTPNRNPEAVMPKGLAGGQALRDIAAYVAQAADRPGQDTGLLASAVAAPGSGAPAVEKAGKLQIPASPTGQLAYVTNKAIAMPGPVMIEMPNNSGVSHNIAVQQGTSGPVLGASSFITKGTTSATVKLKVGSYAFFCQVPGHRQAGMEGTLIVK